MLNEQQRNQIIRTLGTISWQAWRTYRELSNRRFELMHLTDKLPIPRGLFDATQEQITKAFAQCNEAWDAYITVSDAEKLAYEMPYVAHSEFFGELVVDPAEIRRELQASENEAQALQAVDEYHAHEAQAS